MINPKIIAENIVPSLTPTNCPRKYIESIAPIITIVLSDIGFIFENSFLNLLEIANMNPSPGSTNVSVFISIKIPKASTKQLIMHKIH